MAATLTLSLRLGCGRLFALSNPRTAFRVAILDGARAHLRSVGPRRRVRELEVKHTVVVGDIVGAQVQLIAASHLQREILVGVVGVDGEGRHCHVEVRIGGKERILKRGSDSGNGTIKYSRKELNIPMRSIHLRNKSNSLARAAQAMGPRSNAKRDDER